MPPLLALPLVASSGCVHRHARKSQLLQGITRPASGCNAISESRAGATSFRTRPALTLCIFGLISGLNSIATAGAVTGGGVAQTARLVADPLDRGRDFFGAAVAVDGDTAVVGEINDFHNETSQQSATIFVRGEDGWHRQQRLVAADSEPIDQFGSSVCLSRDTAAVGAPGDWIDGVEAQGSTYVFVRAGSTWSQAAQLVGSTSGERSNFGRSCAISGSTLIVGASSEAVDVNDNQGAAYVFERVGNDWIERQRLTASDGGPSAHFGTGIALSGDTVLLSATGLIGGIEHLGAVTVFARAATGSWLETTTLLAPDGSAEDGFGRSVALLGDTAVVGAPGNSFSASDQEGSVYLFARSGESWALAQQLRVPRAPVDPFGAGFGSAVALSATMVVACAGFQYFNAGYCYAFDRTPTGLVPGGRFRSRSGIGSENFGLSAAISGGTLLVGAPGDDGESGDGIDDSGAAYVFVVPPELVFADEFEPDLR